MCELAEIKTIQSLHPHHQSIFEIPNNTHDESLIRKRFDRIMFTMDDGNEYYPRYTQMLHLFGITGLIDEFTLASSAFSQHISSLEGCIAGGFALNVYKQYIQPAQYDGDLDIFIPANNVNIFRTGYANLISFITNIGYTEEVTHSQCSFVPQITTVNNAYTQNKYAGLHKIKEIHTFVNASGRKIQMISTIADTVSTFIRSFDLSCCQVYIQDMYICIRNVYRPLIDAGYTLLLKDASIEEGLDDLYRNRVIKYKTRGFTPVSHYIHHFKKDIQVLPDISRIMYELNKTGDHTSVYLDTSPIRDILFEEKCDKKGYPMCQQTVDKKKKEIKDYVDYIYLTIGRTVEKDVLMYVVSKYI